KEGLLDKGPRIATPTLFFRTSRLKEVGGFDPEIRLEDLSIRLRLTYSGYNIGVMNDVLAYYRLHDSNTYKRLDYMVANVLASYDKFKESEYYEIAKYHYLNGMVLKASKTDARLARMILKMIPLHRYDRRTIRAIPRMLFGRG